MEAQNQAALDLCHQLERENLKLAEDLLKLCIPYGITLGAAESCTGGMVASTIVSIPGSSDSFKGGVVSYANSVKEGLLSVDSKVLDAAGAVSHECAYEMCEGAAKALEVDMAVSTTGIAGPGGGTAEKPVGYVCFGITSEFGTFTSHEVFEGDRQTIRLKATRHALGLLYDAARKSTACLR